MQRMQPDFQESVQLRHAHVRAQRRQAFPLSVMPVHDAEKNLSVNPRKPHAFAEIPVQM